MTDTAQADRRIQKTLSALREAFFELVLKHSYDEIKVADIIQAANVGRSTFYQHFKSKDDILAVSMHYPLSILAKCTSDEGNEEALLWLMEHFWQNRQFAPRIFAGTARRHVVQALQALIEAELKAQKTRSGCTTGIPLNLAAHQLAEAQLVIIVDWLTGKGSCASEVMARHIALTSTSLSKALFV